MLPYHAERDAAAERARGGAALGTTGRGIGPAYADRVARSGIRFMDFARPQIVAEKMRAQGAGEDAIAAALDAGRRLGPHIVDGVDYIHAHLRANARVLLEGAQGSLLDVGYGTYPYVTSSHTIAGGACTGLGFGPGAIGRVIGVFKAYSTRVGAGPMPSELHDDRGERLRRQGGEFGTVTGRPRRCGWFDAVAARYAVGLNALTSAVITKLDVLTGFDRVAIVTGYRCAEGSVGFAAADRADLQLELEELAGWREPIGDLPARRGSSGGRARLRRAPYTAARRAGGAGLGRSRTLAVGSLTPPRGSFTCRWQSASYSLYSRCWNGASGPKKQRGWPSLGCETCTRIMPESWSRSATRGAAASGHCTSVR